MSIHDGHRQRLKGELLAHPESFPDHKLLELLLFYANPRGDTNPTAHQLMDRFTSLSGVLDALPEELEKTPGVGEHAVALLKAVKEITCRYYTSRTNVEEIIQSAKDAKAVFQPYFFGARQERVCLLCMDGKGKCLGVRVIGEGNVNTAQILFRTAVEAALSLNASRAIVAHNHVSGLALPSPEDRVTTEKLKELLWAVSVKLEDHLIFADDEMVSLRDSGFPF